MRRLLPNEFWLRLKLAAISHQREERANSCEVLSLQHQLLTLAPAKWANRKVREPISVKLRQLMQRLRPKPEPLALQSAPQLAAAESLKIVRHAWHHR
jgi:hypothetical protein